MQVFPTLPYPYPFPFPSEAPGVVEGLYNQPLASPPNVSKTSTPAYWDL